MTSGREFPGRGIALSGHRSYSHISFSIFELTLRRFRRGQRRLSPHVGGTSPPRFLTAPERCCRTRGCVHRRLTKGRRTVVEVENPVECVINIGGAPFYHMALYVSVPGSPKRGSYTKILETAERSSGVCCGSLPLSTLAFVAVLF